MSHHGEGPFDGDDPEKMKAVHSRNERIRQLLDTTGFIGALGDYPQGQLTKHDEGAIRFAIGTQGDKVVLDFGTSVHWVGMTAQEAADLASSLLNKAREVGMRTGKPVAFTIGAK
jgi:hypothetical protein